MTKLLWDQVGERLYETGTDRGVLFASDPATGKYGKGVAWNGLTGVTNSPEGAESTPQYADNQVYLNLVSAENFKGTINAFTYPDEFEACDGSATLATGVTVNQQARVPFGFSYRTLIGNDTQGTTKGYKLHIVYGCQASPSSRDYATVNDSPEATALSWDFSTTPIEVPNNLPTAHLVIDSTKIPAAALADIEVALYGSDGGAGGGTATESKLLTPKEVLDIVSKYVTTTTTTTTTTTSKP